MKAQQASGQTVSVSQECWREAVRERWRSTLLRVWDGQAEKPLMVTGRRKALARPVVIRHAECRTVRGELS
ncbi:MAG: hypothetical protein ABF888_01180 [Acetobacter papayae]